VEDLRVPHVDDGLAETVETAWRGFAEASTLLSKAGRAIEEGLSNFP
jgi:hypothetical protein